MELLAAPAGRPVGAAAAAKGPSSPRQPHSRAQPSFAPASAPTGDCRADPAGRPVGAAAAANGPSSACQPCPPASRRRKNKKAAPKSGFPVKLVPRRGLEPPRLSALVPETSASTNSAIWAGTRIIASAFTIAKAFLHRLAQTEHAAPVQRPFAPAGAPTGERAAGPAGRHVGAAAAANGSSRVRRAHSPAQAQFAPAGAPAGERLAGPAGHPVGAAAAANAASSARQPHPLASRRHKNKKAAPKSGFPVKLVPRRGLEPPRLAALVPETSASTNSAIWARRRAL